MTITSGWPEVELDADGKPEEGARYLARLKGSSVSTSPTNPWPNAEKILEAQIAAAELKEPILEHPFAKSIGRKWRFDFAWPDVWHGESQPITKLAVEIDGEVHRTRDRFRADLEKMNVAAAFGWVVLHFRPCQVRSRMAFDAIRTVLEYDDKEELVKILQRKAK